jgi:hypothetical protein
MDKTDDLFDVELDRWVVRGIALSGSPALRELHQRIVRGQVPFKPSRRDSYAAGLIERTGITVEEVDEGEFWASAPLSSGGQVQSSGPTHSLAALRAFVKSQFGEELPTEPS